LVKAVRFRGIFPGRATYPAARDALIEIVIISARRIGIIAAVARCLLPLIYPCAKNVLFSSSRQQTLLPEEHLFISQVCET
jgi:hypothetical protein